MQQIDANVEHNFREHNQEADHMANLGTEETTKITIEGAKNSEKCKAVRLPPLSAEKLGGQPVQNRKLELPHGVNLNEYKEKILTQVWTSYVKDKFTLCDDLIQTEAEFSYAMAVADRIGGCTEGGRIEDGSLIGGRVAASMTRAITWTDSRTRKGILLRKPSIGSVQEFSTTMTVCLRCS